MNQTSEHLKQLVEGVKDQDSLLGLLRKGLGWELHPEFAASETPEIAPGEAGPSCEVYELVGDFTNFRAFLAEFESKYQRRHLRALLASLRREIAQAGRFSGTKGAGDTVFVVASPGYAEVRFVLFEPRDGKQPAIRSFGWSPGEIGRTLIDENLTGLSWPPSEAWRSAWDVEKLTKQFFTELSKLFEQTSTAIEGKIRDENERRLFVQTLFNRLLFLRFVEKKGWLSLEDERGELVTDGYLQALWKAGQDGQSRFWPTRLNALFGAVNHPLSAKIHEISEHLIGTVPYLNGGLFDEHHRFANPTYEIPHQVFEGLLGENGLFYRYNFTVEESSPLDVQVAVDPEILGRIFEELTIAIQRHNTGSYYTPREIVQFMCREALVGYLGSKGIEEKKARKLVYDHDDSELSNQEGNVAFTALKEIKVVDPACGSGAYLLGMLQELYSLFEKLRREGRQFNPEDPAKEAHDRKLHIIENNLYGVDIQAFAANTAMLRLWLTLLVEDTGEKPQPLPNLEYKIEVGDSLLGPDPSQPIDWSKVQRGLDYELVHETVETLRRLRKEYQDAHGKTKLETKEQLEAMLTELRQKVTGSRAKDPTKFDWRVEFFDVFLGKSGPGVPSGSPDRIRRDGETTLPGFDVVLANPPYVRQELIRDQKPALKATFGEFYSGTADLYTYFYARAVQLLGPGGMLAFISSNKWFRAAYGHKLRAFMAAHTDIRSITDFGDLPVFNATAYPMIFIAQKRSLPGGTGVPPVTDHARDAHATFFTQVKNLNPPYPDVLELIEQSGFELPPDAIRGADWTLADRDTLARLRKMEQSGVPLGEYVKGKIYYGIKTGFNEAFVIDGAKRAELIQQDPRSAEIIKPLAVGDDVRRWRINKKDKWLIFTRRGININTYPAIKRHLEQWREELTPKVTGNEEKGRKPGRYKWYEIQDDIAYYAEFDKPKIVYPDIGKDFRISFDTDGRFLVNTLYFLPIDDLFVLGVLNSESMRAWYEEVSNQIRGGYIRMFEVYVKRMPIPRAADADRAAVAALVQKCLDAKAADPADDVSAYEAEIDALVERLYFG